MDFADHLMVTENGARPVTFPCYPTWQNCVTNDGVPHKTTILAKTVGLLTQKLAKMTYLRSPLPPGCSVEREAFKSFSSQSTLHGGEREKLNSLI